MDIVAHWPEIVRTVTAGQKTCLHSAIATVSPDGAPNIAPIGTVFLHDAPGGFFFDRHTTATAENLAHNPAICLLAVNAAKPLWLRSFLRGRFAAAPGVRLYGTAGPLRAATAAEINAVYHRIGFMRRLPGGRLIWNDFTHVRELSFTGFRPVRYPEMMQNLWRATQ